MDFERLKLGLAEIVKVAENIPERFRDRCFEILLTSLLNEHPSQQASGHNRRQAPEAPPQDVTSPEHVIQGTTPGLSLPTLKGKMHVFMKQTNISEETLAKLVTYADNEIHFIHEPKPSNTATGQIEWSLLSALHNALINNAFTIDGNEVKKLCDEKGFLDARNFWAIFRRSDHLFLKPVTSAEPEQTLSADGYTELAKLITSLSNR